MVRSYRQVRGDRLATPIILRLKIAKIKHTGNLFGRAGDASLGQLVEEIVELADADTVESLRSRQVEQEVLDLIDEN